MIFRPDQPVWRGRRRGNRLRDVGDEDRNDEGRAHTFTLQQAEPDHGRLGDPVEDDPEHDRERRALRLGALDVLALRTAQAVDERVADEERQGPGEEPGRDVPRVRRGLERLQGELVGDRADEHAGAEAHHEAERALRDRKRRAKAPPTISDEAPTSPQNNASPMVGRPYPARSCWTVRRAHADRRPEAEGEPVDADHVGLKAEEEHGGEGRGQAGTASQRDEQRQHQSDERRRSDEAGVDPQLGVRRLARLDLNARSLRRHARVAEAVALRVAQHGLDAVAEVAPVARDGRLPGESGSPVVPPCSLACWRRYASSAFVYVVEGPIVGYAFTKTNATTSEAAAPRRAPATLQDRQHDEP